MSMVAIVVEVVVAAEVERGASVCTEYPPPTIVVGTRAVVVLLLLLLLLLFVGGSGVAEGVDEGRKSTELELCLENVPGGGKSLRGGDGKSDRYVTG